MKLKDYIFEITTPRLKRLLAEWRWKIEVPCQPWFINHFGDIFMQMGKTEAVWLLTVHDGQLQKIADTEQGFAELLCNEKKANAVLRTELVEVLISTGMDLPPNYLYTFREFPIVEPLTIENIIFKPADEILDSMGQKHAAAKS
jgi:hypothetical protein